MVPQDVVEEVTGKFYSYIDWKVVNQGFEVAVRKKAVAQRVNRMGKFVLLYKEDYNWDECLSRRESGLIERYSVTGLLLELEKLKKIELSDGEIVASEPTKKQKEILEKLGLCA